MLAYSVELRGHNAGFVLDHLGASPQKFLHRQVFLAPDPIGPPVPKATEIENRFAKGLAGNGPMMNAHATQTVQPLNKDDTPTQLRSLDGGLLPSRSRPNNC